MDSLESSRAWQQAVDIIALLRSPGGCPWDREQTRQTLVPSLIEETYELAAAILKQNVEEICEETGDVMLILLLIAQISEEQQEFTIASSLALLNQKLIRRHPHIFSTTVVQDSSEVIRNWENIKATERKAKTVPANGVLTALSDKTPALAAAEIIQRQAARVGFDWNDHREIVKKIHEELHELEEALAQNELQEIEAEIGDLLFAVVNLSRFLKLPAELALRKTMQRFIRRFQYIEQHAGRDLTTMSLAEMDVLWEEAKKLERPGGQ